MDKAARYKKVKKVTLVGAAMNTLLGFIKIIFGWLGHSHALVADGVHSFSDLLTDFLVLIASRYGSQAADENHPYGHQRIETAATLFLSIFLIFVGLAIAFDAISHWVQEHIWLKPSLSVLWVAVISIIINEALYHYTKIQGKACQSELLIANAWHHRSDAASSLVVLVGVIGDLLGYQVFDTLAAVIVSLMIVKMGWGLSWNSLKELVDSGVSVDTLKEIETIIINTPGVVALHELRTRLMGGATYIDVHLLVDSHLSVSEGHHIGQKVLMRLKKELPHIKDVTIHIDPEDDEICAPCGHLPLRQDILKKLESVWKELPSYAEIKRIQLHYLSGAVEVELILAEKEQHLDLASYQKAVEVLAYIKEVRVFKEVK